jgi:hypothetical protein
MSRRDDQRPQLVFEEIDTGRVWDLSGGAQLAQSVFEADNEATVCLTPEEHAQASAPAATEQLEEALRFGHITLAAAAHNMPMHGTLSERLRAVRDGFLDSDFPDRVQALLEASSQRRPV